MWLCRGVCGRDAFLQLDLLFFLRSKHASPPVQCRLSAGAGKMDPVLSTLRTTSTHPPTAELIGTFFAIAKPRCFSRGWCDDPCIDIYCLWTF